MAWLVAPVIRPDATRLALSAIAIPLAAMACVALAPPFRWMHRHMDGLSALLASLEMSGPCLLIALAAIRRGISCLAWGLLAGALALCTVAICLILALSSRQPQGMAQAGMAEGLMILALLAGQYVAAVGALLAGVGFDLLMRRRSGSSARL